MAKYIDTSTGSTTVTSSYADGWATSGGGTGGDFGNAIAVSGRQMYAGGYVGPPATFGNTASRDINFLSRLTDARPLPVQLVAFTAQAAGPAAVALAWATAEEKNSHQFEVERSTDGISFAKIGIVAVAGTTAATHTHALLDASLPTGAIVLYYRLRQVDLDGTATYSPVRVVVLSQAGLALFLNPTPDGAAPLNGTAPGQAVQVLDALGQVVLSATADASGTTTLARPAGLACTWCALKRRPCASP